MDTKTFADTIKNMEEYPTYKCPNTSNPKNEFWT